MTQLLDTGLFSVADTDSSIGVGWKVNVYATGTSDRVDTYPTLADAIAASNANANPVVLGADGRLPPMWANVTVKIILTDENDVIKKTIDPVNSNHFGSLTIRSNDNTTNAVSQITLERGTGAGTDVAITTYGDAANGVARVGWKYGSTVHAPVYKDGGMQLTGYIGGTAIRPEAQLILSNTLTSGHAIMSLYNVVAAEESAIESVGNLSTGAVQQQGAWFWRWVDSINTPAAYEVVNATHLVKNGQDNTPLEIWGRNSVRVCRGDTANISWNSPPAANIFEVWTSARVGTSVAIGPSVLSNAAAYTVNTVEGFRFEVEGYGQFGQVVSGAMDEAVQIGHNGTTGFVQSFSDAGNVFSPLSILGTTISIGASGQSVGFMGATPVVRPALPAAATDLATVITLANAIRTALINNGLASA